MHNHKKNINKKTSGLSIIELLISLLILGVVSTLFFAPISNAFSANRNSQDQLNNSSQAEQLLETMRSQWSPGTTTSATDLDVLRARFDNNCLSVALPNGASVSVVAVKADGTENGNAVALTPVANISGCSTTLAVTPDLIKRIRISVPRKNAAATQFAMDIIRPIISGGR